ncbi:MAG: phosphoribosylanthranilate isomerase [Nitrospirota bacterium]
MLVKICGITNLSDAEASISYGADALGFIFSKKSPRFIEPDEIKKIVARLPPFISTVGVFTEGTKKEISDAVCQCHLSMVQFHGPFLPDVIEAFAPSAIQVVFTKEVRELVPSLRAYMLDKSHGGLGWERFDAVKKLGRIILAGGLTPENVQETIAKLNPYGVDVCSGVEREKGKKDQMKLKQFIERAKQAQTTPNLSLAKEGN